MMTYSDRTKRVARKIEMMRRKRIRNCKIASGCLLLAIIVLAAVLFIPYDTTPPKVTKYKDSPYYGLIQKINEATFKKPEFKNNYESLIAQLNNVKSEGFLNSGVPADRAPQASPDEEAVQGATYVEVTDNQVSGVIESDIFKRSDQYLYHLSNNVLNIYSIAQDGSTVVGSLDLGVIDGMLNTTDLEMYLSQDCTTVTVISNCFSSEDKTAYVCVRSFNVTDPGNIRPNECMFISGSGISSRMVDGKLLVINKFRIQSNRKFDEESSFLPQYGGLDNMHSIPADNIYAPEKLNSTQYTVVIMLDEMTLDVIDRAAFLSYSDEIYVSLDRVFATRSFADIQKQEGNRVLNKAMTEISAISYSGDRLEYAGSVKVEGSVKNQYAMDEYDGILRVVTSTSEQTYTEYNGIGFVSAEDFRSKRNVNLYCVSMDDFSIISDVRGFAPDGETAESVRFDGDMAYVCTAEVVTLTDPVYYFDLSDLPEISYKDTGAIDGYSSSLVNFGDGYLLGIGFNEDRWLKIEIYEELGDSVVSVCRYELDASFSQDYKAYLIDRGNWIIGLGIRPGYGGNQYLLLQFDGYELMKIDTTELQGSPDIMRGAFIDNWLYLFGEEFKVEGPIF